MSAGWSAIKRRALKHIVVMGVCAVNAFLLMWMGAKLAHLAVHHFGVLGDHEKQLALAISLSLVLAWWTIPTILQHGRRKHGPDGERRGDGN